MSERVLVTGPEFNQDTALGTSTGTNVELATRKDSSRMIAEVQGAIIVAQQFPRNEDAARVKLLRSCKRPGFAEEAEYEFPRSGADITGPSVALAREAARVWGNIQWGFEITAEDDVWRSIRSFAWDVETNSRPTQEDRFRKIIYRRSANNGQGGWITADERELRELTNRRAAIGYRNCILQVIPKDLIDEAVAQSRATLKDRAAADPDGERKRICDAFAQDLNVMPATLEQIIGHKIAEASPAEIAKLRGIYRSIRDGNSTIGEYVSGTQGDGKTADKSRQKLDEIKERHKNDAPDPKAQARREELKQQAEKVKAGVTVKPEPATASTSAPFMGVDPSMVSHCTKHGNYSTPNCPGCEKEAGR